MSFKGGNIWTVKEHCWEGGRGYPRTWMVKWFGGWIMKVSSPERLNCKKKAWRHLHRPLLENPLGTKVACCPVKSYFACVAGVNSAQQLRERCRPGREAGVAWLGTEALGWGNSGFQKVRTDDVMSRVLLTLRRWALWVRRNWDFSILGKDRCMHELNKKRSKIPHASCQCVHAKVEVKTFKS